MFLKISQYQLNVISVQCTCPHSDIEEGILMEAIYKSCIAINKQASYIKIK